MQRRDDQGSGRSWTYGPSRRSWAIGAERHDQKAQDQDAEAVLAIAATSGGRDDHQTSDEIKRETTKKNSNDYNVDKITEAASLAQSAAWRCAGERQKGRDANVDATATYKET